MRYLPCSKSLLRSIRRSSLTDSPFICKPFYLITLLASPLVFRRPLCTIRPEYVSVYVTSSFTSITSVYLKCSLNSASPIASICSISWLKKAIVDPYTVCKAFSPWIISTKVWASSFWVRRFYGSLYDWITTSAIYSGSRKVSLRSKSSDSLSYTFSKY